MRRWVGNLCKIWRTKFKFCTVLSVSNNNYFSSFQNPNPYRRMKAVTASESRTCTPETREKRYTVNIKASTEGTHQKWRLNTESWVWGLFLNMTWLGAETTFEIGDERNKTRDESPTWRSHPMQGKSAEDAELKVILEVTQTKSYLSTDCRTEEARHTHEWVENIALKVQDWRIVFLSASSSVSCC